MENQQQITEEANEASGKQKYYFAVAICRFLDDSVVVLTTALHTDIKDLIKHTKDRCDLYNIKYFELEY